MGNQTGGTVPQPPPSASLPPGAKPLSKTLQDRFKGNNKGMTYDMKVVIRGDRQTGKTTLFHRLDGGNFDPEHTKTPQIQTTHVPWTYKTTDEMVKLEVWDVVDEAFVPTESENSHISKHCLPVDSRTVDVYKGCHAVIFMVDPTRKWTLEYAKKGLAELKEYIEQHRNNAIMNNNKKQKYNNLHQINYNDQFNSNLIDGLIIFGKKDLRQHWTLTESEINEFVKDLEPNVKHLEISLKDCFGMKELHTFFSVPFLRMKCKLLEQDLARAKREFEQSRVEIDVLIKHHNYDVFLKALHQRAAMQAKKARQRRITGINTGGSNSGNGNDSNSNINGGSTSGSNSGNNGSVTGSPIGGSPVAPRIRQTVTSSKDLPLFQQQKEKEEKIKAKQRELEEAARKERERKEELKKQANMTAAEQEAYLKEKLREAKFSKDTTNDTIDKFDVGQLDDDFFGNDDGFPDEEESDDFDDEYDSEKSKKSKKSELKRPIGGKDDSKKTDKKSKDKNKEKKNKDKSKNKKKSKEKEKEKDKTKDKKETTTEENDKSKTVTETTQSEKPKTDENVASNNNDENDASNGNNNDENKLDNNDNNKEKNENIDSTTNNETSNTNNESTENKTAAAAAAAAADETAKTTKESTVGSNSANNDNSNTDEAFGFDVDPDEPLPTMDSFDDVKPGFANKTQEKEAQKVETDNNKDNNSDRNKSSSANGTSVRNTLRPQGGKKQSLMAVTNTLESDSLDDSDSDDFEEPLVISKPITKPKTANNEMIKISPIGIGNPTESKTDEESDATKNARGNDNETSNNDNVILGNALEALKLDSKKSKTKSMSISNHDSDSSDNENENESDDFDDTEEDELDMPVISPKSTEIKDNSENNDGITKNVVMLGGDKHSNKSEKRKKKKDKKEKKRKKDKSSLSPTTPQSPLDEILDNLFEDGTPDVGGSADGNNNNNEKKKKKDKDKKKKKKDKDKKKDKKDKKDKEKKKDKKKKKNKKKEKNKDNDLQTYDSGSDESITNID